MRLGKSSHYHVYACESDEKTITWYIDGEQVLSGPNLHWHLPMNVILSMGLRTPLRLHGGKHGEGNQTFPSPKASTPKGFPTETRVDYVRVWRRGGGEKSAPPSNRDAGP